MADDIGALVFELMRLRPQVLHAWQDTTNILAGVAALIVGVPRIVLSARTLSPPNFLYHQPFMRPGYRVVIARPNVRLLNNSHAGADDYARWLGISRERIGVLLVARSHPGMWFLVAGDGPLVGECRALADDLGIGGRMVFSGAEREPPLAIAAMDVFLLTSRVEGLPNVLLEAQAVGVPVVTTDVGGAREALIQGETGWAVETDGPEALAARVCAVLDDQPMRDRVLTRGPAMVGRMASTRPIRLS